MPASKTHDMIVALITRKLVELRYEIAAIESSFEWLFGSDFELPPAIVRHRPDVLGVRDKPPFIAIGDAKTLADLSSERTAEQLHDYVNVTTVGEDDGYCYVVIGIPTSGARRLRGLIRRLGIASERIEILEVPDVLLPGKNR